MPGRNSRNQVFANYLVLWKSCQYFSNKFSKLFVDSAFISCFTMTLIGITFCLNGFCNHKQKTIWLFFLLFSRPFCFIDKTVYYTSDKCIVPSLVKADYLISYKLSTFVLQCIGPFRVARRRKRSPSPFFLTGNQVVTKISYSKVEVKKKGDCSS